MKDYKIGFEICEADFEHAVGRKPKNKKEFEDFGHYCKKGLEGQIDWSMVTNEAGWWFK